MTLRITPALAGLASALTLTVCAVLAAPTAAAAPDVTDAAAALRSGETVFVDPAAENALTAAEASALAAEANATGIPMFIAVLPESAAGGGTADETLQALNSEVRLAGVYAVVVGDQFRAGSTSGSVADLATSAFRAQRDAGVAAVLSEFVALTADRFNGSGATTEESSSGSGVGGFVFLLIFVGGAAVVVVFVIRRQRRTAARQLAAVRSTVDRDVTEYGERLAAVDLQDPDVDDAARADLQRALDDYDRARVSVASMRRPADAEAVTTALEDGRYALACAQARMAGEDVPARRPPCFVDPRHGPSVGDVLWAPPGLGPRDVPMCAACRTTVETGGTPAAFDVETADGQRRPYYQAGPEYGAYAQGYYSPFAGVMTAVLMGTMLSSMWHMPGITSSSGLDTAGMGGGDSGGWGGGGFGGGGFGGGDFGGGDFGGGDF
jgi:hypothetical protein